MHRRALNGIGGSTDRSRGRIVARAAAQRRCRIRAGLVCLLVQRLELADIDGIGIRSACRDIRDTALRTSRAHGNLAGRRPRYRAVARIVGRRAQIRVRHCIGAKRNRVRRRCIGAGSDRDGIGSRNACAIPDSNAAGRSRAGRRTVADRDRTRRVRFCIVPDRDTVDARSARVVTDRRRIVGRRRRVVANGNGLGAGGVRAIGAVRAVAADRNGSIPGIRRTANGDRVDCRARGTRPRRHRITGRRRGSRRRQPRTEDQHRIGDGNPHRVVRRLVAGQRNGRSPFSTRGRLPLAAVFLRLDTASRTRRFLRDDDPCFPRTAPDNPENPVHGYSHLRTSKRNDHSCLTQAIALDSMTSRIPASETG